MKLAVIFLNKIEYLEDILAAFLEIGVSGATVLDTVGMGRIIAQNIPIFAGLRDAFAGSSPSNKTILSVVQDEKMVKEIAAVVEDVLGSFHEEGGAIVVSIPLDGVYGLTR